MKMYLKPEFKISKFDVEDIMETSGVITDVDNDSAGAGGFDGTNSPENEVSIF